MYFQLSFDDEGVLISSSLEFSEKKVISIVTLLAGLLARALEDDWGELSEEIGLWIPVQITNKEHDDKPEGEEELGNEIVVQSKFYVFLFFLFWSRPFISFLVISRFLSKKSILPFPLPLRLSFASVFVVIVISFAFPPLFFLFFLVLHDDDMI